VREKKRAGKKGGKKGREKQARAFWTAQCVRLAGATRAEDEEGAVAAAHGSFYQRRRQPL
jgi:hypothetical protein